MQQVFWDDKVRRAKELKNCPVFKEIVNDGKDFLINQLLATKDDDSKTREMIFLKIKGLETIDLILQDVINKNTIKKG